MRKVREEERRSFLKQNPTILKEVLNSIGQRIEFMEHPTLGEDSPVYAYFPELDELFKTDFEDCDEFYEGSEYMPLVRHEKGYYAHELED